MMRFGCLRVAAVALALGAGALTAATLSSCDSGGVAQPRKPQIPSPLPSMSPLPPGPEADVNQQTEQMPGTSPGAGVYPWGTGGKPLHP